MRRATRRTAVAATAVVLVAGGSVFGVAAASGGDRDEAITGPALQRASAAALASTGGGTVTETEVGDEESRYEVEVTLADGRQVDVQLDEEFTVVGSAPDSGDHGEGSGGG